MNILYSLINLNRFTKKIILIFLDSFVLFFAFAFSYFVIFSEYQIINNFYNIQIQLLSINVDKKFYILGGISFLNMLSLIFLNFYDTIFRYRGLRTVINLLRRLIFNYIILIPLTFLIFFLIMEEFYIKFYYYIFYYFLLFLFIYLSIVSLQYVLIKLLILNIYKKGKKENILIYGAGSAGYIFSKQIMDFNIIGFIDDDIQKKGYKINNFSIGLLEDYEKLIKNKLVSNILVLIPSINYADRKKIVHKLLQYKIPFRFLNSADNLIKNNLSQNEFQNISPDELIDRVIDWNIDSIENEFRNANVLVTGAGGSIGGDLSKKLSKLSVNNLILFDLNEFNLFEIKNSLLEYGELHKQKAKKIKYILGSTLDKNIIEKILINYSISHVIHAAAFKHVELCELNKFQCLSNNFISTCNLADLSIQNNVKKFLLISTDKSINPTTVMGLSKKLSEQYIQYLSIENFDTIFFGVRFGNVIGSRGSVIPIFQKQINQKKPVTLTHPDMKRYLMSIDDASNLILEAHTLAKTGFIYILNMGKPIKIIEIIIKMINYAGLTLRNKENPYGDIPIKIIGQKKGEKLNEELFNSANFKVTKNKDIFYEYNSFVHKYKSSKDMKIKIANIIENEDVSELDNQLNTYE